MWFSAAIHLWCSRPSQAFNGALRGAASTRRGDALLARFVAQSGCPERG